MKPVEFHKLLRKAVVYYVAGAPEYTSVMDQLSEHAEDGQWEMVQEALYEADEFMAESDAGTLAQKEEIYADREGRESRWPSVLEPNEVRYQRIATLAREYKQRGIKFRQGEDLYRSEWDYIAALLAKDVKRQKDERERRIVQDVLAKVKMQMD